MKNFKKVQSIYISLLQESALPSGLAEETRLGQFNGREVVVKIFKNSPDARLMKLATFFLSYMNFTKLSPYLVKIVCCEKSSSSHYFVQEKMTYSLKELPFSIQE